MVFTLLDGVIFLILTATGLRKKIFDAIPAGVRHAEPNNPQRIAPFTFFLVIIAIAITPTIATIAGSIPPTVYILMVNADFFSIVIGGDNPYGAAYIATAIGAIVGTMLMAFFAKMPLAQASGMGVNAFIVFTLVVSSLIKVTSRKKIF